MVWYFMIYKTLEYIAFANMYAVGFPDWKRIGKKLRDILHPPIDNGPSRDERRAQRLRDSLHGFVYFDDFDEVEQWTRDTVDAIQQSNTPLLQRSASAIHDQHGHTTSVLLCHDYSGLLAYSCHRQAHRAESR